MPQACTLEHKYEQESMSLIDDLHWIATGINLLAVLHTRLTRHVDGIPRLLPLGASLYCEASATPVD